MQKVQEKKLDVAEMGMLRWMYGVAKLDRISNDGIRGTTKVGEISKKVQDSRKWYIHVIRSYEEYVGKRVTRINVDGRRKGRPKRRWMDSVNMDCRVRKRKTGLCGDNLSESSTPT